MPRRNEDEGDGDSAGRKSDDREPDEGAGVSEADAQDDAGNDRRIFHRKVTPEADEANRSLLRLVANLERCDVTDLPPLYQQVDHLVEHLFSDPPPPEAQAELEFSYHGYRIELDQTGEATFMKLGGESPPVSEE